MAKLTIKPVWDRNHRATSQNSQEVKVEVYLGGIRKWIDTNVWLYPGEWDLRAKEVINRTDKFQLNIQIQTIIDEVVGYVQQLQKEGTEVTPDIIYQHYSDKNILSHATFLEWMAAHIEDRNDICESTKRRHRMVYKSLATSAIISAWDDLTPGKCKQWDNYLRKSISQQTTLYGYHKILKAYINEAIRLEIRVLNNPYMIFKVKRGVSAGIKYLTEDELHLIKTAELPELLRPLRDLFLFACYTGLAWSDLAKFNFKDCVQENGRWVCEDFRQKTGSRYKIVILPQAIEIIKRYGGKLPSYSYEYYNAQLKIIALMSGLNRRLTTHMARHTFATLALSKGVHITVVQKMLAHQNVRTTETYAKTLQKDVFSGYDLLDQAL